MLQLDDIKSATRLLSIPFGEGALELEYWPASIGDPNVLKLADESVTEPVIDRKRELLAEYFINIVAWWDLYDGDKPVSLSVEAVKYLPISFLSFVLESIQNDVSGGKREAVPEPKQ